MIGSAYVCIFLEGTIGREDERCNLGVYPLQLQRLQFGGVSNGPLHGTYVHMYAKPNIQELTI